MSQYQLSTGTEQHSDRDRMLAEAFRAGGSISALGPLPTFPRGLTAALESLTELVRVRFGAPRTRLAH